MGDQRPAMAVLLLGRVDGDVVEPAAMAFLAGHHRGDDPALPLADEQLGGRAPPAAGDIGDRVVVGDGEAAGLPQGGYCHLFAVGDRMDDEIRSAHAGPVAAGTSSRRPHSDHEPS